MDQATLDRLNAVDDPEAIWNPADFRYWQEVGALIQLKKDLEAATSLTFDLDRGVQDATFFADLFAPLPETGSSSQVVLVIRFSSFGKLVTVWTNPPDVTIPPDLLSTVLGILEQHGYVYVDPQSLRETYSGPNPLFHKVFFDEKATWLVRYFSYL